MNTSEGARLVVLGVLFVAAWVVVYANLRLLTFAILRRKVNRVGRIVWPLLGLALVLSIVDAFCIEPQWIQLTRHTIATPKLPPGSRLRIVQIADLHLERLGAREIQVMDLTAQAKPDIIVLTGDQSVVKDARAQRELTRVAMRLAEIAPTYAIDGNWDMPADMIALLKGGAVLLGNWTTAKCRGGGEVALGRVSWLEDEVPEPPREVDPLFKVALCHMPHLFDSAAERKIDLMLVGHTHGGQVRLPVFGALLPDRGLVGKYQAGLYRKGQSRLYVSRGVGMEGGSAPRVRFCCRPEVAVFDIVGRKDN